MKRFTSASAMFFVAPRNRIRVAMAVVGALLCVTSYALENGKLPMYPRSHNMNDMPPSAVAMGVPMVLDTSDAVHVVDLWYTSNAKSCTRSAASGAIKYQCATGSIMIYAHDGSTQIAFVPAMASMFGRH